LAEAKGIIRATVATVDRSTSRGEREEHIRSVILAGSMIGKFAMVALAWTLP
jgi:hypothetical protein